MLIDNKMLVPRFLVSPLQEMHYFVLAVFLGNEYRWSILGSLHFVLTVSFCLRSIQINNSLKMSIWLVSVYFFKSIHVNVILDSICFHLLLHIFLFYPFELKFKCHLTSKMCSEYLVMEPVVLWHDSVWIEFSTHTRWMKNTSRERKGKPNISW